MSRYWCCKEEFGFHEKTCENYNDKDEVKRLESRIKELEDFAIWMTGCGYEFTQHSYFNKKRDELLLDYKQNDSCIAEQALKEAANGRSKGFLL